ncbi:MAG: TonB family protein [Bacteroidales bacterium]|jgi:protein TonB
MEAKKTDKANLENKKALFIQIGAIVALSIVIYAFEYKSYDNKNAALIPREAVNQLDEVVFMTQTEPEPPAPQEIQKVESTVFDIVEDAVKIKDEYHNPTFNPITNTVPFKVVNIREEEKIQGGEDEVFIVVEKDAEFFGGYQDLLKYLAQSIKYPQQARETGTSGQVMLTFVVEKDGSITDIKILRDIGSGCGLEAMRVVKEMPKWQPAKQRGKVVRQQFVLPITFNLQG